MSGRLGRDDRVKVTDDADTTLGVVSDPLRTDPTGTTPQPISAVSLPLPTGASTEVTLAALLLAFNTEDFSSETTLDALLTAFTAEDFASQTTLAALLSGQLADGHNVTVIGTVPLPTGASTEAKQDTIISELQKTATIAAEVFAADDVLKAFTWLDFGTKDERVNTIAWSSVAVGNTVTDTYAYTLVGNKYRLDSITRAVT